MNDKESSETEVTHQLDDSIDSSLAGIRLKNQREELKMTVDEVASSLNLDVCYIDAIETNDFSDISSTSYVYGYIRSYAKLLGLPEQEILDLYQYNRNETAKLLPDYMGHRKTFTDTPNEGVPWVLLFFILAGILFSGWWFVSR